MLDAETVRRIGVPDTRSLRAGAVRHAAVAAFAAQG